MNSLNKLIENFSFFSIEALKDELKMLNGEGEIVGGGSV